MAETAEVEPPAAVPAVRALRSTDDIAVEPTKVIDQTALARLQGNTGLTLQWIGWEKRGTLNVWEDRGEFGMEGWQGEYPGGDQYLYINGRIAEVGADYFIFEGEVSIYGTPDADRNCKGVKRWRFGVTQGRKYWRLREFEWCDGLTDYVDIYF